MSDRGSRRSPAYGRRSAAVVAVGAVMAFALAACTSGTSGAGGINGGGTPTDSGSPSSSAPTAGATVTATVTAPAPAQTSHAYPGDYFAAVMTAFSSHDTAYLTLLTSSSTASEMFGWGNINKTWHGTGGQGAAGSSYESFYNNAGDFVTLRASNQELSAKHWHAASVESWDQMTFPSSADTYVHHFVDAWINGNPARMSLLGSASLTSTFQAMSHTPDSSYTTSTDGATGTTYVTISEPSASINIVLAVVNQDLGGQHAIASCYSGC